MKTLAECPNNVTKKSRWVGTLTDTSGLALEVSGDSPFALHLLDTDALIASGKRCDGVLVAEDLTCFIELKSCIDPDKPDRPFEQLAGAVEHFQPVAGTHGDDHHVAWRAKTDLPVAPKNKKKSMPVPVSAEHRVSGLIVVSRGGTRHLPRELSLANGRRIWVHVLQKHASHNTASIELADIDSLSS